MPAKDRLISADSHVVEPLEVFAGVAKRFGKDPARLVETEDRGWVLDTGLGWKLQPGRFATAGLSPRTPQYAAQERSGYRRPCLVDVRARLADMDEDGVEAEVLFPSMLGTFLSGRKTGPDVTEALCRSYNDWIADYCREAPRRLFPLGCVPVFSVDAAVAELVRAKMLGCVGTVIPCAPPGDRPWFDEIYDPLWTAAEEAEMPVALHAGYGSDRVVKSASLQRHDLTYSLRHVSAAIAASDLIDGGVCDRFPRLRFVLAEFGTGWIASFLGGKDWRQLRLGGRAGSGTRFSETWRRSFRATFEDDEIGIRTREEIGVEALLWGSDYPHGDSVWPVSRSTLDEILRECAPEERRAMTAGNVAALYRLPVEG